MSAALRHDLLTARFLRQTATFFFAWTGLASVVGQLADWVWGLASHSWWAPTVAVVVLAGLPLAFYRSWPRPIEESYDIPRTRICIVKGDLFAQDSHLVIGTCDTFDTAIPDIIERTSVQGIALDRLYNNRIDELDDDLVRALQGAGHPIESVPKDGKTERYALGTVAVVDRSTHKLFFVAYTTMDTNNNAHGTPDGLWTSLNSLWASIYQHSNGRPVSMPVIGGGMSRLSSIVPTQDSIRFTVLSFMFASRHKKICDELRIIVQPAEYERLDRLELQAFLSSLKPS
ncbi:hypothetical protein AYK61_00400 [Rhodococcus sp. SBT000017]|uniref:macro domain-containing protein n=1 Tax=unclassified Rhodococcus (in: high G+C Gram-positive bacteria) TaxID=192944 RepID=UPI000EF8A84B|nr:MULTISPECIES: macro domain-containing protein [unclassified Rhodococcus (in: high G+C Gram-positive bacteria)]RMB75303.1 hypothetical protein AYK61_00400 [Rhodococcus sp. SBT000017]